MSKFLAEAILFDFDGTIIDSYPGIQRAFDEAYLLTYLIKNNLSVKPHIGPPIGKILTSVNNEIDPDKINSFIEFFKKDYDTESYKSSVLYQGIKELMEKLYNNNIKIFIVTNKREKPTKLISDRLNINHFFSGVYCSDSKEYYTSKSHIVKEILQNEKLNTAKCILVGDTVQDKIAAEENKILFIHAAYGYENLKGSDKSISNPLDLLNFIKLN